MSEMVIPEIRCEDSTERYGRFVAEPLESGFGTTLGNALRRVLLSSLPGAAVTWVRIDGVQHEFSTIPHVKEDAIEFLLNVKEVRLRPLSDRPSRLYIDVSGAGQVTAADIRPSADYEIVNPELHLATLDSKEATLVVELNVELGKGYTPAGTADVLPIGVIPVDAIFTPVLRVNYRVEATRVGQNINYDRLILEIWTDETMTPVESIIQSAQILMDQFAHFARLAKAPMEELPSGVPGAPLSGGRYDTLIEELGLTVRAYNALKRNSITRVGQLLALSNDELLRIRNFGDKSLNELKERLTALGFLNEEEQENPPPGATDLSEVPVTESPQEEPVPSNEENGDRLR